MMNSKISPFTRTPGVAGKAIIETHFSDEIINNFNSEDSYKYVYKIVGLRGSGKSVEYSLVMNHFRGEKKWLVYSLSAGGNPIQTLISELSRIDFINNKKVSQSIGGNIDASGNVGVLSAGVQAQGTINISENENYYSEEATLKGMLEKVSKEKYNVLVGVDDIAKTEEMAEFLSILGTLIMDPNINIRFICTGLTKNIEDFVNLPHLSFFARNESITMQALNLHSMSQKYRQLLGISHEDAAALSKFTKGYAYGYQVLGEICFNHQKYVIDEEIEAEFDETIGSQYDLIWTTMTQSEQDFIKIVTNTDTHAVADIKRAMSNTNSFNSLRDRLIKKHILVSPSYGCLEVPLPRFKEYVNIWHT